MRKVAEVFPVGEFIREEMEIRGWGIEDLARRMGRSGSLTLTCEDLRILIYLKGYHLPISDDYAQMLGRAFGTSAELWLGIDASYHSALE